MPEEARPTNWLPITEHRKRIAKEIEDRLNAAWRGVRRGQGVTLHQMETIDYCRTVDIQQEAAKKDPEERWQHVEEEKLYYFGDSLVFLDAEGYRFYLPAFLRAMLRLWASGGIYYDTYFKYVGVWLSLDGRPYGVENHYALLSNEQKKVIASFLQAFQNLGNDDEREEAQKCLTNYWDVFAEGSWPSPFDCEV